MWPDGSGGDGASPAVAMRGGAQCSWGPSSAVSAPDLTVVVLSTASGVTPTPESQSCVILPSTVGAGSNATCTGTFTTGGYWFTWNLSPILRTSQTAADAESGALVTALRADAAKAGVAPTFVKPGGARTSPLDCALLEKVAGLPGALSVPGMAGATITVDDPPTATAAEVHAATTAADASVAATSCVWDDASALGDGDGDRQAVFSVTLYPGAAWYLAQFRSAIGATTVSIPGVSDAVEVGPAPITDFQRDATNVAVADGVDLVTFTWQNVDSSRSDSVIPGVLSALGAH
jgi:hypothetical protein